MLNPLRLPSSLRKFIGMILLVIFVLFYALLAMVLAMRLLPEAGRLIQIVYYLVAGFAWVAPAAGIVWFMQKRPSVKN